MSMRFDGPKMIGVTETARMFLPALEIYNLAHRSGDQDHEGADRDSLQGVRV
jgi:hypothetical protein